MELYYHNLSNLSNMQKLKDYVKSNRLNVSMRFIGIKDLFCGRKLYTIIGD